MSHYVYDLLDADGDLLYVGYTTDPFKRLDTHRRSGTGGGDRIADLRVVSTHDTRADGLRAEADRIRDLKPPVNVSPGIPRIPVDPILSSPLLFAQAARGLGYGLGRLAMEAGMPAVTLRRKIGDPGRINMVEAQQLARAVGISTSDLLVDVVNNLAARRAS